MPAGTRFRANNVLGTITDNPLTVGALSFNSALLPLLPTIAGGHAVVTLDPLRQHGNPEMVIVTAHSTNATTAVITRGAYGTTAREHPQGTVWIHAPMNEDVIPIVTSTTRPTDPYLGELIYESDTQFYKSWNGTSWVSLSGSGGGGGTALAYQISTNDQTTNSGDILLDLSLTVTVPAGRLLRITASSQVAVSATSNWFVNVLEDGVVIGRLWIADFLSSTGTRDEMDGFVLRTPNPGTHTYTFVATRFGGAGTILLEGSAAGKRSLVEDITSSPSPFASQNVPVGQLAYAQVTANQGSIAAPTDLSGLNVNVVVPAGRVIRISGRIGSQNTSAGVLDALYIMEGATILQKALIISGAVSNEESLDADVVLSPSAGSHTYKLQADRSGGTMTMLASSQTPAFILVEDITPTPSTATTAPNSTLGYAQVVANQTTISTEVDLTGLSVTVTVPDGRRLRISAQGEVDNDATAGSVLGRIKEGATVLGFFATETMVANGSLLASGEVILTPSSGTHTYKLSLHKSVGAGSVTFGASATEPGFILVEDITGALWPSGAQVTAGLVASEAWTAFTPTFTNITLGAGVTTGRYMKIGRTVHFYIRWVFGAGSAMGSNPTFTLPVTASSAYNNNTLDVLGEVQILDSGTANFGGVAYFSSTTAGSLTVYNASGTYIQANSFTATVPMTWTTNDGFVVHGTYEAAS